MITLNRGTSINVSSLYAAKIVKVIKEQAKLRDFGGDQIGGDQGKHSKRQCEIQDEDKVLSRVTGTI